MAAMNDLVLDVLAAGGVSVSSEETDAMTQLEMWLDLPGRPWDPSTADEPTMEDGAPFQASFYLSVGKVLVHAWNLHSGSSLQTNILLDADPEKVSLYTSSDAIRVTRLLRHWMDLNVVGQNTMDEGGQSTVSHLLLDHCNESLAGGNVAILSALYHHISVLPQLQSHIHLYTQSLMRKNMSSAKAEMTQSRLAYYQQTQRLSERLMKEWEDHLERLEVIVGEWYAVCTPALRRQCRRHLGTVWGHFVANAASGGGLRQENTSASGVRMTLRVLYRILQGVPSPSTAVHQSYEHLLFHQLLPLHRPSCMVLWRDQTSLLEVYHEPLVQCVANLIQKRPHWISPVILALIQPDIWPSTGAHTPKLVLLLHEIDTYLALIPGDKDFRRILGDMLTPLLVTLGKCVSSDHSRLAERALQFFKNAKFKCIIEANLETSLPILLPAMVRREPSWNPTVRKMTYHVLKSLKEATDEDVFCRICNQVFASVDGMSTTVQEQSTPPPPVGNGIAATSPTVGRQDFSLKAGMGSWRPPTAARHSNGASRSMLPPPSRRPRGASAAPPLTVTGVAPWASSSGQPPPSKQPKNPPSTITGVAPWAVQRPVPSTSHKRRAVEADNGSKMSTLAEDEKEQSKSNAGLGFVLACMEQLKPPPEEEGASSWAKAQLAETPTLLPDLKFHDLVFGHELGTGSFGVVKYARRIDRARTRSQWAEYAVKIVSTEKIRMLGYEASIQREISVLRIFSHPGIARLVSSFRFKDGAYLVLEYAKGGDLHSLLQKSGSLDHESARFVIGEVVAALASIHDLGFVYGDLKPENILITETGHIKLTDFGGCRPVTETAKSLIAADAKNALRDLRDGGWRPMPKNVEASDEHEMVPMNVEAEEEDFRVEGTTAYLPPEVVMGEVPTIAADSWALGCVLYQCLSGRPPILEADDSITRERIVTFEAKRLGSEDALFQDSHSSGVHPEARQLIRRLLDRFYSRRPTMHQVANDAFFLGGNIDVFALYRQTAPPLDVGEVAPVADAHWSRRQFSSIWAPQPQAYDVRMTTAEFRQELSTALSKSAPISESEEAGAFFSKSVQSSHLSHISETSSSLT